jgi:negative modulator of initiation of replication
LSLTFKEVFMRTIEVEPDVYAYLVSHTREIGESASAILRRLLSIGVMPDANGVDREVGVTPRSELSAFLGMPDFRRLRNVKDRFVAILGELHRRDPEGFGAVLQLGGRKRRYFAKSRSEIASSGRSVAPREIPGSSYWVMTNASTEYKKTILRDVMHTLGYDENAADEVARALGA